MAVFETISVSHGSVWARIVARMDAVSARLEQHRAYRRTYAELQALTARELDDLGFGRADIRRIASEAAGL